MKLELKRQLQKYRLILIGVLLWSGVCALFGLGWIAILLGVLIVSAVVQAHFYKIEEKDEWERMVEFANKGNQQVNEEE
jgi:hypothetical protein